MCFRDRDRKLRGKKRQPSTKGANPRFAATQHARTPPQQLLCYYRFASLAFGISPISHSFLRACLLLQVVQLANRKGFCKHALRAGAPLVPVYIFGQTQLFYTFTGRLQVCV